MTNPTDLIRRGDAYAACELYPPDDWDNDERDGFFSATSQCRAAIRKLPAHPAHEPPGPGVTAGATDGRTLTVFDWAYTNADGKQTYARLPEVAERLVSEGVKVTPVYVIEPSTPAPVALAEGLDPERLVMAWMAEQEGFATRGERFMETIVDSNDVVPWLHAACQVGIDAALRSALPVGARVAWIATADRLPEKPGKRSYEQIECLIKLPNGDIEVSMWNCEHMCWDDADGDDFRFDPGQPSHWMPLAPIRAALLPAGEEK